MNYSWYVHEKNINLFKINIYIQSEHICIETNNNITLCNIQYSKFIRIIEYNHNINFYDFFKRLKKIIRTLFSRKILLFWWLALNSFKLLHFDALHCTLPLPEYCYVMEILFSISSFHLIYLFWVPLNPKKLFFKTGLCICVYMVWLCGEYLVHYLHN